MPIAMEPHEPEPYVPTRHEFLERRETRHAEQQQVVYRRQIDQQLDGQRRQAQEAWTRSLQNNPLPLQGYDYPASRAQAYSPTQAYSPQQGYYHWQQQQIQQQQLQQQQQQQQAAEASQRRASRHSEQKVYKLHCKSCNNTLSERGMKAVLLLRPNITLYSTDAVPLNCSSMVLPPDMAYVERTCLCLTQSLGCYGCGNLVGYHILSPCHRCQRSVVKGSSSANGHRFVFHQGEVGATERIDHAGRNICWHSLLDPANAHQMELGRTIEDLIQEAEDMDSDADSELLDSVPLPRRASKLDIQIDTTIHTPRTPRPHRRPTSQEIICR